jgi:hypothetical protein
MSNNEYSGSRTSKLIVGTQLFTILYVIGVLATDVNSSKEVEPYARDLF